MRVLFLAVAGICIAFGVACVAFGGVGVYDAFIQMNSINAGGYAAGANDSLFDGLETGFAYIARGVELGAALVPVFLGLSFVQTGLLIVLAVNSR